MRYAAPLIHALVEAARTVCDNAEGDDEESGISVVDSGDLKALKSALDALAAQPSPAPPGEIEKALYVAGDLLQRCHKLEGDNLRLSAKCERMGATLGNQRCQNKPGHAHGLTVRECVMLGHCSCDARAALSEEKGNG